MTAPLERRLRALEGREQGRQHPLSPDEQRAAVVRLLEREGLSEDEAIARFGTVPAFIYNVMIRSDPDHTQPEGDALEAYRIACR